MLQLGHAFGENESMVDRLEVNSTHQQIDMIVQVRTPGGVDEQCPLPTSPPGHDGERTLIVLYIFFADIA